MKISLPGQLRGPECQIVMKRLIKLRKNIEPYFADLSNAAVEELVIIARIDGSLGSFGQQGIGNVVLTNQILECDWIIEDMDWKERNSEEIDQILINNFLETLARCFKTCNINFHIDELREYILSKYKTS